MPKSQGGQGLLGAALMDEPALVSEIDSPRYEGSDEYRLSQVPNRNGPSNLASKKELCRDMDGKEYQDLAVSLRLPASNVVTDFLCMQG
jgi:hypothetical protein